MVEYIKREDAINLLWLYADESCASVVSDFESLPWCTMATDSPDPDMERDCGRFIRAQRWIPTKEQMPENFGRYLVSDGSNVREAIFMTLDIFEIYHLPVGWYYENHYYHSFDPCHDFFTHWMPLPEPPEVSE